MDLKTLLKKRKEMKGQLLTSENRFIRSRDLINITHAYLLFPLLIPLPCFPALNLHSSRGYLLH